MTRSSAIALGRGGRAPRCRTSFRYRIRCGWSASAPSRFRLRPEPHPPVLLVLLVVALEPAHLAVPLEGQDVRGNPIQEPAIVGDDHGAAGKLQQRVLQGAQRVRVQVVRRLIQEDEVAPALRGPSGRRTRLRPARFLLERRNNDGILPILVPIEESGVVSLTLNSRELELLRKALTVLSSPLGAEHVDEWRGAVNRVVRELFQADQAVFLLAGCGADLFQSNEYNEDDVLGPYVDYYKDLDEGMVRVRRNDLEVFCRRQIFDGEKSVLLNSECYNDFLSPNGMEDSLGLVSHSGKEMAAGLWVHNQRVGRPMLGDRGLKISALLHPAFAAGTAMRRRFHGVRNRLGALVDTLDDAVAVVGADGKTLHMNGALRSLLAESPAREAIEMRIQSAARAAADLHGSGTDVQADGLHQRLTVAARRYEMQAVRLERPVDLSIGTTMVVVRQSVVPPAPAALRTKFGLTTREAEVAILLWNRKQNEAIAEELVISPHTARHHTEHILRKVGIHSRKDVRTALEP